MYETSFIVRSREVAIFDQEYTRANRLVRTNAKLSIARQVDYCQTVLIETDVRMDVTYRHMFFIIDN